MRRALFLIAILALLGLPALAAATASAPTTPPAPAVELESSPVCLLDEGVVVADTVEPLPADPGQAESMARCPIPNECRRDRDCDAVCGPEFGGECRRVNSCYRECACAG